MTTTPKYLSMLNDAQREAVTAPFGAQLVVAGAGSGKTRVITSRIAYLINEKNIHPKSILALTFTNKAGREMKERIAELLDGQETPFVGTFHSYCVSLLRKYRSLLPYPDFTIFDTEDQRSILRKLLKTYGLEKEITPARLQGMISFDKNHLPGQQPYDTPPSPYFLELKSAYEEEKARAHAFDFDDLLLVTLDLFSREKGFAQRFQENVRHILVDEYQDTNQIQHELLRRMALNSDSTFALDSICGVGDEDQSIYSWRGAQADNMSHFTKDFAPVSRVKIEQNYRSVQPILETANHVIKNNMSRNEKNLWSDKTANGRVMTLSFRTGYHEAETIAQSIKELGKTTSYKKMAILYRAHHQSRMLEEALMHNSVPYVIVGGIRFYERKEIKDLIAYMRLVVNPFDRPSFLRVVNMPSRGVGNKTEAYIMEEWDKNAELPFSELLPLLLESGSGNLTRRHEETLGSFLKIFAPFTSGSKPSEVLKRILDSIQFHTYLRDTVDPNDVQAKLDNIDEFEQAIAHFETEHGENATIEKFLEDVALMQEQANNMKNDGNAVSLMTLHAAKGLEFENVVITGLEEDLFPSSRSISSIKGLEEERRLFYVGITRAKEWLLITHSSLRTMFGNTNAQTPSRFIDELPNSFVLSEECGDMLANDRLAIFCKWRGIKEPARTITFRNFANPAQKRFVPRAPKINFNSASKTASAPTGSSYLKQSLEKGPWRPRMMVKHAIFGKGTITAVAKKGTDEWYLTIKFPSGLKKLSSKFVSRPD